MTKESKQERQKERRKERKKERKEGRKEGRKRNEREVVLEEKTASLLFMRRSAKRKRV